MSALRLYLYLAFAASVGVAIGVALTGGQQSPLLAPLGMLVMLAPALSVLAASKITGEKVGVLGFRRFSWKLLPAALLLLPVLSWLSGYAVLTTIAGELPWAGWLTPDAAGMLHPPAELHMGDQPFHHTELPLQLAVKAITGVLLVSVIAIGEEIGWRSFMQPRLVARFGVVRGIIIAALIWAVWHSPFAISGVHSVEGMSQASLILLAPLGHFGYGLVLGWLWERTESLWIVALAHGAGNNWANLPFRLMEGTTGDAEALVARGLVFTAAGGLCLWSLAGRRDSAPGSDRPPAE